MDYKKRRHWTVVAYFLFALLSRASEKATVRGLEMSLSFEKAAYPAGGYPFCNVRIKNNTSLPLLLNYDKSELNVRESLKTVGTVYRLRGPANDDERLAYVRYIDRAETKKLFVSEHELVSLAPGNYVFKLRYALSTAAEKGVGGVLPEERFVEAETILRIVQPHQRLGSKADPSADLKVNLADSREVPDNPEQNAVFTFTTTNAGEEPWFYKELAYHNGVKIEVADLNGKEVPLNPDGLRLAKKWGHEGRINNWPQFDLLPGDHANSWRYVVNQYAPLEAGHRYKVRIVWSGEAYRSINDRDKIQNPVPFEILSEWITLLQSGKNE